MVAAATGSTVGRRASGALAAGLYLSALALAAQGISEAMTVGGPAAPLGSLRWRFGFLGVVFFHLPLPLLGLALASATASLLRHRLLLLVIALIEGLLGLTGLIGLGLFALDATQMAGNVPAGLRGGFTSTVVQTGLLGGLGVILIVMLAIASVRGYRLDPARSERRAADGTLVVHRS